MLSKQECRALAQETMGPSRVILDEYTLTYPWGWAFFGATEEFACTRNYEHALIGEGLVFVDKHTGRVEPTGGGLPPSAWAWRIERERGYRPWWKRRGTLAGCACVTLAFAFEQQEAPSGFLGSLDRVRNEGWFVLYRCARCGVFWCVEAPASRDTQMVVRVEGPDRFPEVAEVRLKFHLLEECGGTVDGTCSMHGCERSRVRDRQLCVDHLWENGLRQP